MPGDTLVDIQSVDSDSLYSLLNVPRDAATATIQAHYKILSKAFHPDKTPLHVAKQTFLDIKQAQDVLSDNVLRQVYDVGGLEVALQLKKTANAKLQQDDLYDALTTASKEEFPQLLKDIINLIQNHLQEQQESHDRKNKLYIDSVEITNTKLAVATQTLHLRNNMNVAVETTATNNNSLVSIKPQVNVECYPHANTTVRVGAQREQLSVTTQRAFQSGTTCNWTAHWNQQQPVSFHFESLRLFNIGSTTTDSAEPNCLASWRVAGFPTLGRVADAGLGIRAVGYPHYEVKVNPFQAVSFGYQTRAQKSIAVKFKWNPFAASLSQQLLSYQITWVQTLHCLDHQAIGVQFGARWSPFELWNLVCKLDCGAVTLRLPVAEVLTCGPLALWFVAVRAFIHYACDDLKAILEPPMQPQQQARTKQRESSSSPQSITQNSMVADIIQRTAQRKRNLEQSKRAGLVIVHGELLYESAADESSTSTRIVTDILQFWVKDDNTLELSLDQAKWLHVPTTTTRKQSLSIWQRLRNVLSPFSSWVASLSPDDECRKDMLPVSLRVRYQYRGSIYELTVREQLSLPSKDALRIGSATIVV
jgi:curved DNA-binding protein CbpA